MKKDSWFVETLVALIFVFIFLAFSLFLSVKWATPAHAESKIINPQPVVQKIIPSPHGYKWKKWGLYLRRYKHPQGMTFQLRQADRNFWMRRMWRTCPDDPTCV